MLIGIDGNEANVTNRVGSNHVAFELLHALTSYPSSHRFVVYLKNPPLSDMPVVSSKLNYRVLTPKPFWTQWRLPGELWLHRPRPDIFFSPGHYAPRSSPVKTMVTILDLAYLKYPNLFLDYRRGVRQLQNWTTYSVKQAAHIFAISQNTKQDLIKYYPQLKAKITVIYPGINLNIYKPQTLIEITRVKQKYALRDKYFLAVGTIQPRKNYVRLIKAFEKLSSRYNAYDLVFAGAKGWLTEDFQKAYDQSKQKRRLKLLGFVPDSDLLPLLSGAACVLLVGLYEGFGLPAAQALACGSLPVVAKTASLPEVVGKSGILVDPFSISSIRQGIITAVRLKPNQRQAQIESGINHLRSFSWSLAAKKIMETADELALQR